MPHPLTPPTDGNTPHARYGYEQPPPTVSFDPASPRPGARATSRTPEVARIEAQLAAMGERFGARVSRREAERAQLLVLTLSALGRWMCWLASSFWPLLVLVAGCATLLALLCVQGARRLSMLAYSSRCFLAPARWTSLRLMCLGLDVPACSPYALSFAAYSPAAAVHTEADAPSTVDITNGRYILIKPGTFHRMYQPTLQTRHIPEMECAGLGARRISTWQLSASPHRPFLSPSPIFSSSHHHHPARTDAPAALTRLTEVEDKGTRAYPFAFGTESGAKIQSQMPRAHPDMMGNVVVNHRTTCPLDAVFAFVHAGGDGWEAVAWYKDIIVARFYGYGLDAELLIDDLTTPPLAKASAAAPAASEPPHQRPKPRRHHKEPMHPDPDATLMPLLEADAVSSEMQLVPIVFSTPPGSAAFRGLPSAILYALVPATGNVRDRAPYAPLQSIDPAPAPAPPPALCSAHATAWPQTAHTPSLTRPACSPTFRFGTRS
ncbi:hypothetical protein DFH06DRAFT_1485142 [Mycena polygramma]|nr:hypothetical protein DFH06DRAFT_1485142 [Mycena polygramma]